MGTNVQPKFPPNPFSAIGSITQITKLPCSWNPMILIKSGLPALLQLFWSIGEPEWKQDYKLLGQGSWLHGLKAYAEDVDISTNATAEAATEFLFAAAEWADLAAFYLWLADMLDEATYNWSSNWFAMAGCNGPRGGTGLFSAVPVGACAAGGKFVNGFDWDDVNGGTAGMGTFFEFAAGAVPIVVYQVSGAVFIGDTLVPVGTETRCIDDDTLEIVASAQSKQGTEQAVSSTFHFTTGSPVSRQRQLTCQATTAFPTDQCFPLSGTIYADHLA